MERVQEDYYYKACRKYLQSYLIPYFKDSNLPIPKNGKHFLRIFKNLPEGKKKKIMEKIQLLNTIGKPSIRYYSIPIRLKLDNNLNSYIKEIADNTFTTTSKVNFKIIDSNIFSIKNDGKAIIIEVKYEDELEIVYTLEEPPFQVKGSLPLFIRLVNNSEIIELIGKKRSKAEDVLMSVLGRIKNYYESNPDDYELDA